MFLYLFFLNKRNVSVSLNNLCFPYKETCFLPLNCCNNNNNNIQQNQQELARFTCFFMQIYVQQDFGLFSYFYTYFIHNLLILGGRILQNYFLHFSLFMIYLISDNKSNILYHSLFFYIIKFINQ